MNMFTDSDKDIVNVECNKIDSDKPVVISSQWIPVDESKMPDKQVFTMQVINRAERRRQDKEERRRK